MKQIFQPRCSVSRIRGLMMVDFGNFLKNLFGILKAFLRLLLVTANFFLSGLNDVVFGGREVCGFSPVYDYLSQDIDKLSYIDRLSMQISGEGECGDDYEEYVIEDGEDEE